MQWFGLEGNIKEFIILATLTWIGHFPPGQVAQGPIQPNSEHLHGQLIQTFSEQHAPVSLHFHNK